MTTLYSLSSDLDDSFTLAKRIGSAPTSTKSDGVSPFYTIPIIQDDSTGAVVSDSVAIAAYLDKTYPSFGPILILPGTMPLQLAFSDAVIGIFAPFRPFFAWGITRRTNDATALYYLKNEAKRSSQHGGAEGGGAREATGKREGEFWENEQVEPCFADTVICAFLRFTRRMVGEESEEWKDIVTWNDGRWGRYLHRTANSDETRLAIQITIHWWLNGIQSCLFALVANDLSSNLTGYITSWDMDTFYQKIQKSDRRLEIWSLDVRFHTAETKHLGPQAISTQDPDHTTPALWCAKVKMELTNTVLKT
ncbi:uncharacterized protein EV420DRAFT_1480096 [Desarmillaria tabescens]|uniref:GST N-terminal domain-containing protein n=1 Tax=Armillaria tabescens TaxID=1929756 RepID=A0AA39KB50_ARMTA|nr:uncharacterized protein EV420DRAFT_1480096 [Desarmillaria tabescens]KAK0457911.1 hypothetical protein EV420DRAFT_1480096 [Desarmillaria tabescens]